MHTMTGTLDVSVKALAKWIFLVTVCAFLCLPACAQSVSQARRALLIGVNEYPAPSVPNLRGAVNDTKTMYALLVEVAGFRESDITVLTDGAAPSSEPPACFDRFVSNFVFDLLSEADIAAVVSEAHRMLRPGGLLCLASLSPGHGVVSRTVIGVWSFVHRLDPRLVAGCRPIALLPFLKDGRWKVRHHRAEAPFGLPSEAVVAEEYNSQRIHAAGGEEDKQVQGVVHTAMGRNREIRGRCNADELAARRRGS